ncbi:tetraspanin-10-like isoform X2 [Neltuma alba]|uniref:tetraspanin-10-like isoform X2 n=1 Tax=Neltuma alba TaxID=207710 RepID=UPI0010A546EE|nr:tetraspanin-10-like isoform X2 [Prosopis alba]
MGVGTSNFVIRWINFFTMLLAVAVIIFGIWMSNHHDGCRKSLTLLVIGLGAFIFIMSASHFLSTLLSSLVGIFLLVDCPLIQAFNFYRSVIGFFGALKNSSMLLWVYLITLCFILIAILVFTVLAYKEYQLEDYSSWFLKQLNNSHNWARLRSCLVKSEDCNKLSKKYKTLKQYELAKLTPIEAGCCRPPSECGYPAVNASYYDLTFHPVSPNHDCKRYKNSRAVKCYDCDSCKAGVAQYMKTEWRIVAIFNVVLFVVLSIIYFVGCCARRNAARSHSKA